MQNDKTDQWLNDVRWGPDGLIPVVTQDIRSGRVLTHAWVNREALQAAHDESRAVYWSRSRGKLWRKGEESGNVQKLHRILLDCDGDTLCYLVQQIGGIACHTGRESCFYRVLEIDQTPAEPTANTQPGTQRLFWRTSDPVLKDPSVMYGKDAAMTDTSTNTVTNTATDATAGITARDKT